MTITLIAAAAGPNMVIGKNGDLPWHFPSDLKFFKAATIGQTVLMGRVTFDSIVARLGTALPNRRNLVATHDKNFSASGAEAIGDLPTFLGNTPKNQNIFVIGGASIYQQALPYADVILLTHIDANYDGDAVFPAFGPPAWIRTAERSITENGVDLHFCTYQKTPTA